MKDRQWAIAVGTGTQKRLGAGLGLVLAVALCVPDLSAVPINYVINFTATSGIAPTAGSFTYDAATPVFTNFTVEWQGIIFDHTSFANAPTITTSNPPTCLAGLTGPAAAFELLGGGCNGITTPQWVGGLASPTGTFLNFLHQESPPPNFRIVTIFGRHSTPIPPPIHSAGDFTIATTVPEPGTLTLCLSALLALGACPSKRWA